jgi:hypothetical protein
MLFLLPILGMDVPRRPANRFELQRMDWSTGGPATDQGPGAPLVLVKAEKS